jgi:hypothetical protein
MIPRMPDRASSLLLAGFESLIIGLAAVILIAAVLLAGYGTHIYLGLNWFFAATVVINSAALLPALVIGALIIGIYNYLAMLAIFLYSALLVIMLAAAAVFGVYLIFA